jgi:signal recognition particle subunit SRP19
MRKQEKFILWPQYFDTHRKRSEGRRIPKNLALASPRLEELQRAAQRLGLVVEVVPDVAYPAVPWVKSGMLLVGKKGSKLEIMRRIAREVAVLRLKPPS